jgi:RTX calcium-binding nonapeptide repeat (4 copies)
VSTRIAAIMAVLVATAGVGLFGLSQSSTGTTPKTEPPSGPVKKVTICHATGSQSNPYVEITVPGFQFVYGVGHGGHTYDIWPSFQYKLKDGTIVTVPAHGDQSILKDGCEVPGHTPEPCPTVTVTVTASPSAPAKTKPTQCPTVTATATATETTTETATATATVTVTATPTAGPFVPSTGCPPPNLFNAIRGNRRDNTMVGTPCRDVMAGHGGTDTMFGAAETDIMLGQRGNDRLDGGTGIDTIRGGFGNDVLRSNDGTPGDRMIGGLGRDVCIIDPGDSAKQCERVIRQ